MKYLFILVIAISLTSCKDTKNEAVNLEENRAKSYNETDGLITMHGEFVYFSDAAILQTTTEIYGVVIDANMNKLNELVKPYKNEATDMVPVTVRVRKFEKSKDEEGWPFKIEIKDILKVEAPKKNKEDVIKLSK